MFSSLKSSTTLMAFVLFDISISNLGFVKAAPRPTPIALFDIELIKLKARNETSPASIDFRKQNGLDAQRLNAMFETMNATDACQDGQMACIDSQFAQCTSSTWTLTPCASGTSCFALPLVNKPGTSLACDVPSDADARFEAAGVQGGPDGSGSGTGESDPDGDDCDGDDGDNPDDGSPDNGNDVPSGSNAQPTLTTVTTTVTLPATPTQSNANDLNLKRRQLLTALSSSALPSETQPSPSSSTSSSSTSSSLSASGVSSSSVVGIATPTVVLGQNGIVTVTVVSVSFSIVTVTASNCGPSSSASLPTSSPVSTSSPDIIPTPSTLVSSFSFTSESVSPTQTPDPFVQSIPDPPASGSSTVVTLQAADPTTTTPSGGISFSMQVVSPTPAPVPASNPTPDVNISELLTATIGGT